MSGPELMQPLQANINLKWGTRKRKRFKEKR